MTTEIITQKACSSCKQEKPRTHFSNNRKNKDGKDSFCKSCQRTYFKKWRKTANGKARLQNSQLKYKFNVDLKRYSELMEKQNHACAICKTIPNNRRLDVDHCHLNGTVRGLLCNQCNQALGLFQDSKTLLKAAIEYLASVE